MIVAETADRYRFVTQPDHAALAGQFADRWGNDTFGSLDDPAPLAAAYIHDDGWWTYDRRPHPDADGRPLDFTEVPAGTWIALYDEGIAAAVDLDRYTGLLVSMHGAGLRRRRYGLSPSWPDTPPDYSAFVDRQEDLQTRLAKDVREEGRISGTDVALLQEIHGHGTPPDGGGGRLWYHYRLLQAWDTLSLSFCTTATPPGYGAVDLVPTAPGGGTETLSVDPLGNDEFRVTPYPFDESPLTISVATRTVSKGAFDGDDPVGVYYTAGREVESFTIRRPG